MSTWVSMVLASQADNPRTLVAADGESSGPDLLRRTAGCVEWLPQHVTEGTVVPALLETGLDALSLTLAGAAANRPLAPLGPRLTVRELAAIVDRLDSPVLLCLPEFA